MQSSLTGRILLRLERGMQGVASRRAITLLENSAPKSITFRRLLRFRKSA